MEKLGWFFNNEWMQRERINEAAEEINSLRAARADAHGAIERLFALDRAQGQELAAVRVTLEVLTNLLIESGAIDERTLRYRIEAAWANNDLIQKSGLAPSAYETLGRPPEDPETP
ncbi:MAG TPA: hypothetical protein VFU21_16995 [Kofleriaceae bacterium]|nr:hypothetical protein [Kofleriaceae bacterium]